MTNLISLEEAKDKAIKYLHKGYHCGPAVLQVMWESCGMENEDFLWAAIPFMGGISGHQNAPCGAVSGAAVFLGLRHRCPLADKEKAKQARNTARLQAGMLVKDFQEKFGDITCRGLIGIDFNKPGEYQAFLASGKSKETCESYVLWVIEKLYSFEKAGFLEVVAP
jgi:C_GCAxxG_C_C family probable redox protein